MQEVEKGFEKISLNDKKKDKVNVDFKKYTVKMTKLKEEKRINLPTPNMLEEVINLNIVSNLVLFDRAKYESFIKNDIIDLSNLKNLKNSHTFSYLIIYLGGINSQNIFSDEFPEFSEEDIPEEENFIENCNCYQFYLNKNRGFFTGSIGFGDFIDIFLCLEEIGITFPNKDNNVVYRELKDLVLGKNKICILIAPSNNFWIKSEKKEINQIVYDKKLNNCSNIFYNKKFIYKFLLKIGKHPRVYLGLLSSMNQNNLKSAKEGLDVLQKEEDDQFSIKDLLPKELTLISQNDHDNENGPKKGVKPKFVRNFEKIMSHLKNDKKEFNATNILILESEPDKINNEEDNRCTKYNSIHINTFSEQYLEFTPERKKILDEKGEKLIDYVYNLLENSTDEIREYINKHPFEEDK